MRLLIAKCSVMLMLAGGSATFVAGQTASQDMKNAGQDTKDAGKNVGHATKKTAKKVKRGTKKAVNTGARETEKGAAKVDDKTRP